MKKILVISPTPSHPQNAGNRARIFQLLDRIQQQGHEIHFMHVRKENRADDKAMRQHWDAFYPVKYKQPKKYPKGSRKFLKLRKHLLKEDIVPWGIDDWYDPAIEHYLEELQESTQFDTVIVEYIFFSKALERFDSKVIKLIDTHDVFTDRHKLYINHHQEPGFFYTTKKEEKIGLSRADVVIAIQEEDRKFFSQLVGKKQVIVAGHPVRVFAPERRTSGSSRRLLFVGSINIPNIKSMAFFLRKIWPALRQHYPDSRVDIVGTLYMHRYRRLQKELPEGCYYHGEVDDLLPYYQAADVVINPMLFATGLSIKMVEALGYSKPVVTTSIGCRGLEAGKHKAFRVADTPEQFVQAISELFDNPAQASMLAENAYRFAEQYNQRCMRQLIEILEN